MRKNTKKRIPNFSAASAEAWAESSFFHFGIGKTTLARESAVLARGARDPFLAFVLCRPWQKNIFFFTKKYIFWLQASLIWATCLGPLAGVNNGVAMLAPQPRPQTPFGRWRRGLGLGSPPWGVGDGAGADHPLQSTVFIQKKSEIAKP